MNQQIGAPSLIVSLPVFLLVKERKKFQVAEFLYVGDQIVPSIDLTNDIYMKMLFSQTSECRLCQKTKEIFFLISKTKNLVCS